MPDSKAKGKIKDGKSKEEKEKDRLAEEEATRKAKKRALDRLNRLINGLLRLYRAEDLLKNQIFEKKLGVSRFLKRGASGCKYL